MTAQQVAEETNKRQGWYKEAGSSQKAADAAQRWLLEEHGDFNEPMTCLLVSKGGPLVMSDGNVPEKAQRVCRCRYTLQEQGLWLCVEYGIEVELTGVIHHVLATQLADGSQVAIDWGLQQFPQLPPPSKLVLYLID